MDPLIGFFTKLDPTIIPLGAIVTFMVFGLIRGWVVPRQVMEDRIDDKNTQITGLVTERDNWKDAYQVERESRTELDQQNKALIEGAQTTNRLLDEMRIYVERMNPTTPVPPAYRDQPPQLRIEETDA